MELLGLNQGLSSGWYVDNALPRQSLCVENLSALMAHTPCHRFPGSITSLLTPEFLFHDTYEYSSMILDISNGSVSIEVVLLAKHSQSLVSIEELRHCPIASSSVVDERETRIDLKTRSITSITPRTVSRKEVLVEKAVSGTSLHSGSIVWYINATDSIRHVSYVDHIPWFLEPQLESLVVEVGGVPKPQESINLVFSNNEDIGGIGLSCELLVEDVQSLYIAVKFTKRFLHFTVYPPDVSRGFDLPSGIAYITPKAGTLYKEYSTQLLVLMPFPDDSMPFNVIALSSTFFSMMFSNLMMTLYRTPAEIIAHRNTVQFGWAWSVLRSVYARVSAYL